MTKKSLYDEFTEAIKTQLNLLNLEGSDFEDTPQRVAKMWLEFLNPGRAKEPELKSFSLKTRGGMVILKNHKTYGFCPHHLLPVEYNVKIGYLPEDRVVPGASKPIRVTEEVISKLPLQEDIPGMIIDELLKVMKPQPKGIGVIVEGKHLCTRMRGIKSPCLEMVTDCMQGLFLDDPRTREEFLIL